jgi:hypothetical protein
MTDDQFDDFKMSLKQAVSDDGLSLTDCDIRLKGSSANFYSGWHKLMPYHREVLRDEFLRAYERNAEETELDNILAEIKKGFPNKFLRSIRRPFDSMTRIGVSPTVKDNLSDYDVQVSSGEVERKVRDKAEELGMPIIEVGKEDYGFFNEKITDIVCRQLQTQWPSLQTIKLGRNVNVKIFSASGPPNLTAKIGNLSSHLRGIGPGEDWKIIP